MIKKSLIFVAVLFLVTACFNKKNKEDNVIRVASHKEPMTEIVKIAGKEIEDAGYTLELIPVSNNTAPNIALNNKEIDANFFQHVPYMNMFNEGNNGTLVPIQPIYDAVLGFYSKNLKDIKDLPANATIAIPNDFVNEARALAILKNNNIIQFKEGVDDKKASVDDVINSNYTFKKVDLLTLSQAYHEVDLVFNYPAYIKELKLTPNDALITEPDNGNYYAITLVAREDNKDSDKIKVLKKAISSDKVREYLANPENSITVKPAF